MVLIDCDPWPLACNTVTGFKGSMKKESVFQLSTEKGKWHLYTIYLMLIGLNLTLHACMQQRNLMLVANETKDTQDRETQKLLVNAGQPTGLMNVAVQFSSELNGEHHWGGKI